jgi:Ca-activated chloride channel family protein
VSPPAVPVAPIVTLSLLLGAAGPAEAWTGPSASGGSGADARVIVRGTDEHAFPEIRVDFELRRPDGTAILDARREDFQVAESDHPVEIEHFAAPLSVEIQPTTVVLVLDRSRSMLQEDRLGALKEAVKSFLEVMPKGSRVAIVAFSDEVRLLSPFNDDIEELGALVDRLRANGSTRFYDAVARALELIGQESGRRAILALTDGMDTSSRLDLEELIPVARGAGVPVHTLGLGSEGEIATETLRELAAETRGQWFHAPNPEQLRSIFEQLARGLGESYTVTYHTDRKLPDGTLRPVRITYKKSGQSAEAAVFIRGMVVPARGWSRLCLLLVVAVTGLALLPGWLSRRKGTEAAGAA